MSERRTRYPSFHVTPIAGALGAVIEGVDLSRGVTQELVRDIRAAWLDHLVVFFRDQTLDPGAFLAFAKAFGPPDRYPFVKGLTDHPEIIEVTKREHERVNFGGIWHSDTTYLEHPPMGAMLLAREVPPFGGDTLFANMYLAFEALSGGIRKMLDGMIAISSSAKADVSRTREDRINESPAATSREVFTAEHPVVRTHPETGRKALYVNVAHTLRFKDMTEEESRGLLGFLCEHQVRPEFTCRFSWQIGSLAFWDNRCAQHNPVNDYHSHRRVMHRISLAGDRPR